MQVKISDSIKYIGVDDKTIDLFESQYLVPNGISYNSYLIVDEKVAIMDTVDKRKTDEWLENLDRELNGRTPDYLVISHLEPDHASNIKVVSEKYPSMKLVGNAKTFSMLPQFFPDFDFADKGGVIAKTVNGINKATSYGKNLVKIQDLLKEYSDTAIDAPFYTNHDMARGAGYYSGDNSAAQTKIAEAMNLLMTGNVFLYYGEELGMKGAGKDENKRAPMYWSLDENAEGMCDGPKDMEPIKMKYDSLEEQEKDGNSIYNYVKQVIALRNQYPAIARGEVAFDEGISDTNICAIQKTYEDEKLTIVFNISAESQTVDLTKSSLGVAAEDTDPQIAGELIDGTEIVTPEDNTLIMPAYSIVILK